MYKNKIYNHNSIGDDMTEKELAYFEDAVGHEENIIKILEQSIGFMQDESLISFMNEEVVNHKARKERLMNYLKEMAND